jgi:hypothetical protein
VRRLREPARDGAVGRREGSTPRALCGVAASDGRAILENNRREGANRSLIHERPIMDAAALRSPRTYTPSCSIVQGGRMLTNRGTYESEPSRRDEHHCIRDQHEEARARRCNFVSDLSPLADMHALEELTADDSLIMSVEPLVALVAGGLQHISLKQNCLASCDALVGANYDCCNQRPPDHCTYIPELNAYPANTSVPVDCLP